MLQQDQKHFEAKIANKMQSEKLPTFDPQRLVVFLNSVNPSSFGSQRGGRVTVSSKIKVMARNWESNPTETYLFGMSYQSKTVIRVLLDSGSYGDLMFHKKEHPWISLLDLAGANFLAYIEWQLPH